MSNTAPRYTDKPAAEKCFLCGKAIKGQPHKADTRDSQIVHVGPDCAKKIRAAGETGIPATPWPEGVRLYAVES